MSRRAALALLAAAGAGCSTPVRVVLSGAADLATTEWAIGAGYSEGNPFGPSTPAGRAAVKGAALAALLALIYTLRRKGARAPAAVLEWAAVVSQLGAAVWNTSRALRPIR